MPEVVRKQPSVVQACVDTPFDEGFDLSTLPPLSNSSLSTQIMFYYTTYIYWVFFSSFWCLEWWDMVMGRVLTWYVHRRPSLADFFLYLTGIGFLQDAEAARMSQNTDDHPRAAAAILKWIGGSSAVVC